MKKLLMSAAALTMSGAAYAVPQGDQPAGFGGPEESAEFWPACRPGRGDDRCIQLYERGVREHYAAWTEMGSETGMGGPDEGEDDLAAPGFGDPIAMLSPKNPALGPLSVSSPDGSV